MFLSHLMLSFFSIFVGKFVVSHERPMNNFTSIKSLKIAHQPFQQEQEKPSKRQHKFD